METFEGKGHLPGADREWNIVLEIEWGENEASIRIDEAPVALVSRFGGECVYAGTVRQRFDVGDGVAKVRLEGVETARGAFARVARVIHDFGQPIGCDRCGP